LGTYDEVVLFWRWFSCRIASSGEKKDVPFRPSGDMSSPKFFPFLLYRLRMLASLLHSIPKSELMAASLNFVLRTSSTTWQPAHFWYHGLSFGAARW
jgi:hypothetical protein